MASLDCPKLRPLSARRFVDRGQVFAAFEDPVGAFSGPVLIPIDGYHQVVRHFDGETSLSEIQSRVSRETGQVVTTGALERLVEQLDAAMVLDGPTFNTYRTAYASQAVRPAAHAGRSYPGDEHALRAQIDGYFTSNSGAGQPGLDPDSPPKELRGVLSPHIDFYRGGPVYTWAYRELVERSDADVFVVLGVAHQYCSNRFALTRKDFDTPLGLVRTDREYVDRLASQAGPHLFDDELTHRTEHSIEFQAVFLQYLLGGRRDFTIVPILVGSFHDLMESKTEPIESAEVQRFVEALKAAEVASGKKVAYIGGIDLSHVGPEFGDPEPVSQETLGTVDRFDHAMLDRAAEGDPSGWFGTAGAVGNRWRVCGLAATYTMLHAMGPARGRLLKYSQAVDERRTCCVSFASLVFDDERPEVRNRA